MVGQYQDCSFSVESKALFGELVAAPVKWMQQQSKVHIRSHYALILLVESNKAVIDGALVANFLSNFLHLYAQVYEVSACIAKRGFGFAL